MNIAVTLFRLAVDDLYDKVILISGDTDVLPAMRLVQAVYPHKKIGVVIPIGRASEAFKQAADFHYRMTEQHLQQCLFADPHVLRNGTKIAKPASWV